MSWLNARTAGIAGASIGAAVLFWPSSGKSTNGNPFNTPAAQAIGDRYSAGGGTTTHMPAVATPRGNAANVQSPQTQANGINSDAFKDSKSDQKVNEPGVVGKAFYGAQYGNEKGK